MSIRRLLISVLKKGFTYFSLEYKRMRRGKMSPTKAEVIRSEFGMWATRIDIDDDWLESGRTKWNSDFESVAPPSPY